MRICEYFIPSKVLKFVLHDFCSIDKPFELVKKDINDTFASISFNVSVLPIPEQNTVEFCSQMDTSVIDDLGNDLVKAAHIGIIVLAIITALLIAANCTLEWYKWRLLKQHLQNTRDAWTSDPTICKTDEKGVPTVEMSDYNLLVLHADSAHPFLTRLANQLATRLHLSPSQYTHLRFFFNYVFHPPALACFLIGVVGLLSVELQLLALGPLLHEYSQRASASTADFSNAIASSINASMYNQSAAYATEVNSRIAEIQSTVNDGLFGWVNGTTTALNNTINGFYTDVQNIVNTIFNGTVLDAPAQEFIKCLIGSKVQDIEEALTFLNQNLHINLTQVNNSVLVLSPENVNEATQPIAQAALGGGNSTNSGIIGSLVNDYAESLKSERVMFGVFMALWCVVMLMAFAIIFWHSYGRDWMEAYKRRRFQTSKRASVKSFAARFRSRGDGGAGSSDGGEKVEVDEALKPSPPPSKQRPTFEKSWDDCLDHVKIDPEEPTSPPDRKPSISAKLMAVGRKVMSRNKPQEDEEKVQSHESDASSGSSWIQRMTGMVGKKDSVEGQASESESMKERVRPKLTISPPPSKVADVPQGVAAELKSAWSISPGLSTTLPWHSAVTPTIAPLRKPDLPATPRRRTASVPSRVDSVYDEFSRLVLHAQPPATMPVPLYYGFESPLAPAPAPAPTAPKLYRFPPVPEPKSKLAPPPLPLPPNMNPDTSTPVTRLLTTTHARHSSLAVDPFVTPFDDEHRVPAPETPKDPFADRRSMSTNPFVAL